MSETRRLLMRALLVAVMGAAAASRSSVAEAASLAGCIDQDYAPYRCVWVDSCTSSHSELCETCGGGVQTQCEQVGVNGNMECAGTPSDYFAYCGWAS